MHNTTYGVKQTFLEVYKRKASLHMSGQQNVDHIWTEKVACKAIKMVAR